MTEREFTKRAIMYFLTIIAGVLSLPIILALFYFSDEFKYRISLWAAHMQNESEELIEYAEEAESKLDDTEEK